MQTVRSRPARPGPLSALAGLGGLAAVLRHRGPARDGRGDSGGRADRHHCIEHDRHLRQPARVHRLHRSAGAQRDLRALQGLRDRLDPDRDGLRPEPARDPDRGDVPVRAGCDGGRRGSAVLRARRRRRRSVARAAVDNFVAGGITSGSSTLTMQLVKNINVQQALNEETEADRKAAYAEATATSFDRKLKEMKLAIGLEKRYTKARDPGRVPELGLLRRQHLRHRDRRAALLRGAREGRDAGAGGEPDRDRAVPEPPRARQSRRTTPPTRSAATTSSARCWRRATSRGLSINEAIAIPVDEAFLSTAHIAQNGCRTAATEVRWFCDYVVKNVKNFPQLGVTQEEREANWALGGYQLYTTLDYDVQARGAAARSGRMCRITEAAGSISARPRSRCNPARAGADHGREHGVR